MEVFNSKNRFFFYKSQNLDDFRTFSGLQQSNWEKKSVAIEMEIIIILYLCSVYDYRLSANIVSWLSPCRYVLWQKLRPHKSATIMTQNAKGTKAKQFQFDGKPWKVARLQHHCTPKSNTTKFRFVIYNMIEIDKDKTKKKHIIYNVQTSNYMLKLKIRTICVYMYTCVCVVTFLAIHSRLTNQTANS